MSAEKFEKTTVKIKEKQVKYGRKQPEIHEACRNFINFCGKKLYDSKFFGNSQSFNEFLISSKIFYNIYSLTS